MTATPIPPGFLYAICAAPGEDTPRLALADWLDEHGDVERAGYIRHHVRGDKLPLGTIDSSPNLEWHPIIAGWTRQEYIDHIRYISRAGATIDLIYRRGFAAEVRCDLATLLGGECGRCNGGRWHGQWDTPGNTCPGKCDEGRTPGIAAVLFKAHPVVSVRLTDRGPHHNGYGYSWFSENRDRPSGGVPDAANLPADVWHALPPVGESRIVDGRFKAHKTADDATEALSRAVVAVCRDRAGLPPLTPTNEEPKR
jgi:uncharacterized protein (TIGR02996 family)